MSAKTVLGAVLVGAWFACAAVRGQEPIGPPPARTQAGIEAEQGGAYGPGPAATFGQPAPGGAPVGPGNAQGQPGYSCGGVLPSNTGLSDWIQYRRDNGCNCSSGGPPMMVELYLRSGVSVPVGGTLLGRELDAGWRIDGGGRTLWFNQETTKAWTVDVGIVNVYNGARGFQQTPLSVLQTDPTTGTAKRVNFGEGGLPGVTIRGLNRTMVGTGIGREYYLWAPANAPGNHWRIGFDFGGRYGTEKMDYHEIKHRTRVLENGYVAGHTDLEWSCGHCIYFTGARCEWDYTANTIMQRQSDFQDISALITLGVRW